MKVAFTTNICPHYRVKTFEHLASHYDVDYYFFSSGKEWYWQEEHGTRTGNFHYEYLPGFSLNGTRITLSLPLRLWQGGYDVYIKCILGRFALPVTYLTARFKRRPFILWTGIWTRLKTPTHRIFFPITKYIYSHSDAIVVYGDHVKNYLIREGVYSEKIFIAAHAIDNYSYNWRVSKEKRDKLRQQLNIDLGQKMILYLGRLEYGKGISYLLEAFASLASDDVILVIAGTGSEHDFLKELALESGIIDRVRFPGYIPPEQTVVYYSLAWVYVLPSISTPVFKEPWGLVVNEAFNQGVPVIATESVGAAAGGLVKDGVNGFIIPERDSKALSQSLKHILNAPELRDELSKNSREIISEWDNEKMVQGFRNAIEYVMRD
jgi:glycosyltransferase involved in cell wall biosynthesis